MPSMPTATTTRDGGQHPADPNDLGSPSDRSPSPTHTVYSTHRRATTQWHTGHYPSTTDTTRLQAGGRQGSEQHNNNLCTLNQTTPHHNVPTTAPAPQTEAQAPHHASVPRGLDRTEYSTQNMDYSHPPWRDSKDLDSPSDRSRGRAPGAYAPSPTHTVYSAQREEPRPNHATTPCQTDHSPRTVDTTGFHGGRAAGWRTAQRRLGDPEPDHTPSQCTDHSAQATNGTTYTTPRRPTPTLDRTEYSAQNTDYCHTPQHKAQHHDDLDNVRGPEPQRGPLTMEAMQPRTPEDHRHEASLSVSNRTSRAALETQVSTPADAINPAPKSLPSSLDIPVVHEPMDLDNDPLQDSTQRVLQAATAAHQRVTWSLYRALSETDHG